MKEQELQRLVNSGDGYTIAGGPGSVVFKQTVAVIGFRLVERSDQQVFNVFDFTVV